MGAPVGLIVQAALAVTSFIVTYALRDKEKNKLSRDVIDNGDVPLASEGDPIPLTFGRTWVKAPNTIYYTIPGYHKVAEYNESWLDRVAGIEMGSWSTLGEFANVLIDLAVCLGDDVTLLGVEEDGQYIPLTASDLIGTAESSIPSYKAVLMKDDPTLGGRTAQFIWYNGSATQPSADTHTGEVWANNVKIGEVDDFIPSSYPYYRGLAHLIMFNYMVPAQGFNIPNLRMYVEHYPTSQSVADTKRVMNDGSMNAALVLLELLENQEGGLGLDASTQINVASFLSAVDTLAEEQQGVSITVSSRVAAETLIGDILEQIDAIMYQDFSATNAGEIVLKLIRDDYAGDDLLHLDESNVVEVTNWNKTGWEDTYNTLRVGYTEPDNTLNTSLPVIVTQDSALLETQERIRGISLEYANVHNLDTAKVIAKREMGKISTPFTKLTVRANREAYDLKPGDVFQFSWDKYDVAGMYFRAVRIGHGSATDSTIVIDALEDRYADNSGFADNPGTGWTAEDQLPATVTDYAIVEMPWWLASNAAIGPSGSYYNETEIIMKEVLSGVLTPVDTNLRLHPMYSRFMFLAAEVDGLTSYSVTWGKESDFATDYFVPHEIRKTPITPSGTVAYSPYITHGTGEALGIIPSMRVEGIKPVGTAFRSTTPERIRELGKGLMYCAGEFAAYTGATFVSSDPVTGAVYDFTNVYRGLMGTGFVPWSGERVWFIEDYWDYKGLVKHLEVRNEITAGTTYYSSILNAYVANGDYRPYEDPLYFRVQEHKGAYSNPLSTRAVYSKTINLTAFKPLPPTYVTAALSRAPGTVSGTVTIAWLIRSTRLTNKIELFNDPQTSGLYTQDDEVYYNVVLVSTTTGTTYVAGIGVTTYFLNVNTTRWANDTYKVYVYTVWTDLNNEWRGNVTLASNYSMPVEMTISNP